MSLEPDVVWDLEIPARIYLASYILFLIQQDREFLILLLLNLKMEVLITSISLLLSREIWISEADLTMTRCG